MTSTYDTLEASVHDGNPVELYSFAINGQEWLYTNSANDIAYSGKTYSAKLVTRHNLETTEDTFKNMLEIDVARDDEFATQYIFSPAEGIISVTIFRGHSGDFVVIWTGTITEIVYNSDKITIKCAPITDNLQRVGLRRKFQLSCVHPLYCTGCNVDSEAYKIQGNVVTIDGFTITSPAFATKPDGWFAGGQIAVGYARRMILAHTGSTITISSIMSDTAVGNAFIAYPGCDRTMATCKNKFNNLPNYGGQPFIPVNNPFGSNGIV